MNPIAPTLSTDLKFINELLDWPRPQVVIVVGTGVAINATGQDHASWLGLLQHGIRHLVETDCFTPNHGKTLESSLNEAFSPFHLGAALQHAEIVEQVLNTPSQEGFAQWLESAFANFKPRNDEKANATLAALRDLHEAGALLLTTNYDSLLSDITGAPPVTWEDHDNFHRVITRNQAGILHVHGHWQRPTSIVLGRSSYQRVVACDRLQELLRSLWLEWSWIYVGCGDGLDDPNLGRLLEWSKSWGESALPDFFLARHDKAKELNDRPGKPPNVRGIGYLTHDQLPVVLHSVTPAARSWPFVRVDEAFHLFHLPGESNPFPTRQEYLDRDVPTLHADSELSLRLEKHGWAACIDVASVGKTTLALRMATTPEQRAHPVFYLDLKRGIEENAEESPLAAVNRLARPGVLLILDNAHDQPELARQIWQQWHAKPSDSRGRLLLVATLIQQTEVVTPEQELTFFEKHPLNPAVLLRPTADDLGRFAKHLYRRMGGANCPAMPEPPTEVLAEWHRTFGAALNAFTLAVLGSLPDFQKGNWLLPESRASSWVRKHWLHKLDAQELENAACLAAFGAQELEMLVDKDALPHPNKTETLFKLGLVSQAESGPFKQYRQFELREPGWGRLILAALDQSVDEDGILFVAASRSLRTATVLSSRLRRDSDETRLNRLWEYLAPRADSLVKQTWGVPLSYFTNLVRFAKFDDQSEFVTRLWEAIESEPAKVAAAAWASQLDQVGSFLGEAKTHGRNTTPLWEAIESEPAKFAAAAWASQLDQVGFFLGVAKAHGRNTTPLWEAIESEPAKLAAAAWVTPLGKVGFFLGVAKTHGRNTTPLWEAIESEPAKLAAAAWASQLDQVGSFLGEAKTHGCNTTPLWEAIESEPAKLAAAARASQLDQLESFLGVAKTHGRNTTPLWEAIESEPAKVAAAAWASQLDQVGSFLGEAKTHGRNTTPLWEAIESEPAKVAAAAWASQLDQLGSFLGVAKTHGRNTTPLCEILADPPDRLSQMGKTSTLDALVGFGHYAPISLLEIAIREIGPGHWNSTKALTGATWLAGNCANANREDLAVDLITLLLRRANWRDFPSQGGGYGQVCWLLANVPASATYLVEPFLEAVRTDRWLQLAYAAAGCGQLASGLRQLALNQSLQECQQFHHRGLGGRLSKELARFGTVAPNEQSQIVQFLGCAELCGWAANKQSFVGMKLEFVSKLPLDILPHGSEATKVEAHQMQLWLGLRTFVSITQKGLPLPREAIEKTLNLWRVNLRETESVPETASHRVNRSMVGWLEASSKTKPSILLPSQKPLWTLVDYPNVRPS